MTDKTAPMDAGVRESATGTPSTNSPRACWAIKTLVAEFRDLFPETATEYSNRDGRNTALSVTFDLTGIAEDEHRALAVTLLELLNDPAHNEDRRIDYVLAEDEQVLVTMRANPRTQDSREPFGLTDAFHVLVGDEDEGGVFGGPLSHPGAWTDSVGGTTFSTVRIGSNGGSQ